MDNEVIACFFGVVFGAVLTFLAIFLATSSHETACEEKHNVYDCDYIYAPVNPEGQTQ